MSDATRLSLLIGEIYDASLDGDRWPAVLESITGFIGSSFANLFSQDESVKAATAFYSYGIPAEFHESYGAKYISMNPMFPATLLFETERVILQEEIIPHVEFRQTSFYKEWAEPLGWFDAAAVLFEKSASSCSMLAVARHEREGMIDAAAVNRMKMLVPHLRRSLVIGKTLEARKIQATSFSETLDGLAAAMILVGSSGRIVHANVSGQKMLASGTVIRAVRGRLTALDDRADAALNATFANATSGDAWIGDRGVSVPVRAKDEERFVAHVLPLTSGARQAAGAIHSAVAAVFVRRASLERPHGLEALAKAFELTAAEMRVFMMIINIGGVPEVAPVLGISEATVRTHLQHIYSKTGTTRQADLVKLAAGYMSPLSD